MKCPNCGHKMRYIHAPVRGDHVRCDECSLDAPRDVLERLAARLAPAGVLAEAEQVLCSVGIYGLTLVSAYHEKRAKKGGTP